MKNLLRNKLFILACCVCGVILSSSVFCSFGGKAPDHVTGQVHLYGNVPFEFPGFETDDGHLYTLVLDDKNSDDIMLEQISARQGELLELTGKIIKTEDVDASHINKLRDGEFVVYSFDVVKFKGIKAE